MKVESFGGPQGQCWMFLDWDVWADFQTLLFFFPPPGFVESPFPFFYVSSSWSSVSGTGVQFASLCLKVKVTQSCPTLCDPMDYTVHGILQARILEWVAFPFSRGSPQPRNRTQISRIVGRFFTSWATREAQEYWSG